MALFFLEISSKVQIWKFPKQSRSWGNNKGAKRWCYLAVSFQDMWSPSLDSDSCESSLKIAMSPGEGGGSRVVDRSLLDMIDEACDSERREFLSDDSRHRLEW